MPCACGTITAPMEKGQETRFSAARGLLAAPYATLVSRLVLGGVFVVAGATKIPDPGGLAASIRSYGLPLPEWFVSLSAYALPYLEVMLGLYLLAGLFTRTSAWATTGLMAMFTARPSAGRPARPGDRLRVLRVHGRVLRPEQPVARPRQGRGPSRARPARRPRPDRPLQRGRPAAADELERRVFRGVTWAKHGPGDHQQRPDDLRGREVFGEHHHPERPRNDDLEGGDDGGPPGAEASDAERCTAQRPRPCGPPRAQQDRVVARRAARSGYRASARRLSAAGSWRRKGRRPGRPRGSGARPRACRRSRRGRSSARRAGRSASIVELTFRPEGS